MIDQGTKTRIEAEETFRREIAVALDERDDTKGGRWKQVWKLLNSAVGIWLLSTVLVGFVTWSYARSSETRADQRWTERRIEQLDTEISFRLRQLRETMPPAPTPMYLMMTGLATFRSPFPLNSGEGPSLTSDHVSRTGVYADLAGRDLFSMIWELRTLIAQSGRVELDVALGHAEQLNAMMNRMFTYVFGGTGMSDFEVISEPIRSDDARTIRALIDQLATTPRWQRHELEHSLQVTANAQLLQSLSKQNPFDAAIERLRRRASRDRVLVTAEVDPPEAGWIEVEVISFEVLDDPPEAVRFDVQLSAPSDWPLSNVKGYLVFEVGFSDERVHLIAPPVPFEASFVNGTALTSVVAQDVPKVTHPRLGATDGSFLATAYIPTSSGQ